MMKRIRRRFVTVGNRQFHYIWAGSGPPVVLLHACPKSSSELAPLVNYLSRSFTAICFDMPGYGNSDRLEAETPEIINYADALDKALATLGVMDVPIYGRHTGALIAFELMRRHPERISAAVFDGFPVFTNEERQDFLTNYLPQFRPVWDGLHLVGTWARVRENYLIFPWYRKTRANRTVFGLPDPEQLQDVVMDVLRAGDGYRVGYAAAFRYVPPSTMDELTIPSLFMAKQDDLICSHLDRLPTLPECCIMERLTADRTLWMQRIESFFLEMNRRKEAFSLPETQPITDGITKSYLNLDGGEVLCRDTGEGTGRTLVMLHDVPGSSAMIEKLMYLIGSKRCAMAIDLPGNGESDELDIPEPTISDFTRALARALDSKGIQEIDLYGTRAGGQIAIEFSLQYANRVRNLILDGVMLLSEEERRDFVLNYAPPIVPQWDGGHLLAAWNMLRDQAFFWPWYNRTSQAIRMSEPDLNTNLVHERVVEVLKHAKTYPLTCKAAFSYPTRKKLGKLTARTLVCSKVDDLFYDSTREAGLLIPNATAEILPEQLQGTSLVINRFLGHS